MSSRTPYTKEYFLLKGVRDEMISLKKAYGSVGVPQDTWVELEAICKEAAIAFHMAQSREPADA